MHDVRHALVIQIVNQVFGNLDDRRFVDISEYAESHGYVAEDVGSNGGVAAFCAFPISST